MNRRGVWLDLLCASKVEMRMGNLSPVVRKDRRARTRAPVLREGFAGSEAWSMSRRRAIEPTRTRQECVSVNVGLVWRVTVYRPHVQLKSTNRLDGAMELEKN